MAIIVPSQEQIITDMLSKITNSLDKREGSLIRTAIAPIASYINKTYQTLQEIEKQGFLTTASGKYLELITVNRGITRMPATYSVRRGIFNIEIPIGTGFTALNGNNNLKYTVTEFIENKLDEYHYKLTCQTEGMIGNNYTGNLQSDIYIDGLNKAELTDIITAGEDTETDASLRNRYIETLNEKGFGGNIASYIDYFNTRAGVGAIEVFPFWNGGGTTLVSVINSSYDIPDDLFIQELQKEICPPEADDASPSANGYGLAPIGAIVTITKPELLKIDIECKLLKDAIDIIELENKIKEKINQYLLTLRKTFGTITKQFSVGYEIKILYARVYSDIFGLEEVLNLVELKINGKSNEDVTISNTKDGQFIPVLGDLIIYEA